MKKKVLKLKSLNRRLGGTKHRGSGQAPFRQLLDYIVFETELFEHWTHFKPNKALNANHYASLCSGLEASVRSSLSKKKRKKHEQRNA
jgi:hypothetical protein